MYLFAIAALCFRPMLAISLLDPPAWALPFVPYILYGVALGLLLLVAWLVTKLAPVLVDFILTHVHNLKLQTMMVTAVKKGAITVLAIDQKLVDGLKAAHGDGKLTPDEAKSVGSDALTLFKNLLGEKFLGNYIKVQGSSAAADVSLSAVLDSLVAAKNISGETDPVALADQVTGFAQGK